jgi:hypothetical protein
MAMQKLLLRVFGGTLIGLAIVLLSASLAGSASAGYWHVIYDLAPGSTVMTKDPLGNTYIDPIEGQFTIRYDAAAQTAPLTGARLLQGHTNSQMYQPGMFFVITGTTDMNLVPQVGGAPGTLSGANLDFADFAVVANSSTTGFLHCNENVPPRTGETGNCALAGMPHTVPQAQTPTGPGPFPQSFPKFVFTSGTAGVGDFTSTVETQTVQSGYLTVTLYATYVGREINRVWKSSVPSISSGGLALLGGLVSAIAVGGLAVQRRHREG